MAWKHCAKKGVMFSHSSSSMEMQRLFMESRPRVLSMAAARRDVQAGGRPFSVSKHVMPALASSCQQRSHHHHRHL